MTREEAQAERDRLAEEHPEATWIVSEAADGWQVLKVGIPSAGTPTGSFTAAKPKPPEPEDPRGRSPLGNIPGYG